MDPQFLRDEKPGQIRTYCKTDTDPSFTQSQEQDSSGESHEQPAAHIGGLGGHGRDIRIHRTSAEEIILQVVGFIVEVVADTQYQYEVEDEGH